MTEPLAHPANADQATYWNGAGGRHWTERQAMQDALLAPLGERLIAASGVAPGERIVDIGCGCGDNDARARRGHGDGRTRAWRRPFGADDCAGAKAGRGGEVAGGIRRRRRDRV